MGVGSSMNLAAHRACEARTRMGVGKSERGKETGPNACDAETRLRGLSESPFLPRTCAKQTALNESAVQSAWILFVASLRAPLLVSSFSSLSFSNRLRLLFSASVEHVSLLPTTLILLARSRVTHRSSGTLP